MLPKLLGIAFVASIATIGLTAPVLEADALDAREVNPHMDAHFNQPTDKRDHASAAAEDASLHSCSGHTCPKGKVLVTQKVPGMNLVRCPCMSTQDAYLYYKLHGKRETSTLKEIQEEPPANLCQCPASSVGWTYIRGQCNCEYPSNKTSTPKNLQAKPSANLCQCPANSVGWTYIHGQCNCEYHANKTSAKRDISGASMLEERTLLHQRDFCDAQNQCPNGQHPSIYYDKDGETVCRCDPHARTHGAHGYSSKRNDANDLENAGTSTLEERTLLHQRGFCDAQNNCPKGQHATFYHRTTTWDIDENLGPGCRCEADAATRAVSVIHGKRNDANQLTKRLQNHYCGDFACPTDSSGVPRTALWGTKDGIPQCICFATSFVKYAQSHGGHPPTKRDITAPIELLEERDASPENAWIAQEGKGKPHLTDVCEPKGGCSRDMEGRVKDGQCQCVPVPGSKKNKRGVSLLDEGVDKRDTTTDFEERHVLERRSCAIWGSNNCGEYMVGTGAGKGKCKCVPERGTKRDVAPSEETEKLAWTDLEKRHILKRKDCAIWGSNNCGEYMVGKGAGKGKCKCVPQKGTKRDYSSQKK